jgi:hypothetical protein
LSEPAETPAETAAGARPRKRPLLAALLQMACVFGGFGYAYLGQWRKLGLALGGVLLLQLVNAGAAQMELKAASMLLGPLLFCFKVLTAWDAWQLAQAHNEGVDLGNRTSVPALRPLLGDRD